MKTPYLLVIAITTQLLPGCGPSKEVSQEDIQREHEVALRNAERDFRPSEYGPDIRAVLEDEQDTVGGPLVLPSGNAPAGAAEIVQGYRVQVFSTTDFTQAQSGRSEAQELFPDQQIYLVYEPPTYKIRVGDFLARFDAEQFMTEAVARGFSTAWVVPERVYKNPRPPSPTPSQKNQRPQTE